MSRFSRYFRRLTWRSWVVATALTPGLTGAGLTLAGVHNPVADALTLLFLLVTPACCAAFLLPRLDPLTRVTVAGTFAIVLATAVAQAMLTVSVWSVRGGIAAVAGVSALLALTGVLVRRKAARP